MITAIFRFPILIRVVRVMGAVVIETIVSIIINNKVRCWGVHGKRKRTSLQGIILIVRIGVATTTIGMPNRISGKIVVGNIDVVEVNMIDAIDGNHIRM
jgi:hypothetical protein